MSEFEDLYVPVQLRFDASGALDEDLFCLDCGYNLRGLRGDPLRCPECGRLNDLGTVAIPAPLIRTALHGMETNPTWCVILSLGLAAMAVLAVLSGPQGKLVACVGMVGFFIGWMIAYRGVGEVFLDHELGKRLVLDFHAITGIFLVPFLVWLAAIMFSAVPRSPMARLIFFVAPVVVCWTVAIRKYRAARHRLAVGQRHAAVRIARQSLRHILRQERDRNFNLALW
jgi:hypothetical protein